jgi:hypothetical protein
VQSLDEPSSLHTPPPMMFFRAVVVPILGKSASAIPGSCSSEPSLIQLFACESFGLQKSSNEVWLLTSNLFQYHQKFSHLVDAAAVWVGTMREDTNGHKGAHLDFPLCLANLPSNIIDEPQ